MANVTRMFSEADFFRKAGRVEECAAFGFRFERYLFFFFSAA